ncbi:hypothetical protein BKA66DRAFT_434507 [Pyrenochaeta sp. MPI-SDFR-AT-0127]|nr:hypothetical protein BKA66DRAFT_434507 [Pyrenochaeta sp. MPI-SDFR-AT-0127]
MMGETLVQQHPPTPPNTGTDYHSGLHQVVQYNTDRNYPFSEANYHSPGSVAHEGIPSHATHVDGQSGSGLSSRIEYDAFSPTTEYYQNGQYNTMPNNHGIFGPPTPRSSIDDDSTRRTTRSGRPVAPSSSPRRRAEESPQPKPTPRARKTKAGKSEKPKTPKLTAPLSILTSELHHIPVKNMEEWVNRSADTRRGEVEKRNGYITRPMNSFMLYRSAYADRAKAWCLQNNHQVVSSVAGESWPLEPPEIRDLYNEYAKIERINHQNAHPAYKFSPSKTAAPIRKRKGEWSDNEEPSDLDDEEWAPGSGRSRTRQARRLDRSLSFPTNGMSTDYFNRSMRPNSNAWNRASWETANEGRPMPMPVEHNDMYNQYYQTASYANMNSNSNFADNLRMRRVGPPASSVHFPSNHALLGLPGGNAGDIMQQLHSNSGTPFDEGQLDPILLAYDGRAHSDIDPTALQQHGFRNGHPNMVDGRYDHHSLDSILELGNPHDEYRTGSWQSDPTMSSLEQESEFDKWMGEQ